MTEAQRAVVDIDGYVIFFKQFHLFLSVSLFMLVTGIDLINSNLAGIILGIYPLLGYCYFMLKSRKYFSKVKNHKRNMLIAVVILGITIFFSGKLFYEGFSENKIVLGKNDLEITGMYGEKINRKEIVNMQLVNSLPEISMRSNGFSAGDFRKGYFKTKDRKTVKLFVNKKENPLLLLNTTKGVIYFSSSEKPAQNLFKEIEAWRGFN